jgi:hypothetical protein
MALVGTDDIDHTAYDENTRRMGPRVREDDEM